MEGCVWGCMWRGVGVQRDVCAGVLYLIWSPQVTCHSWRSVHCEQGEV